MREPPLMRKIMVAMSQARARMFRNQVGQYRTDDGRWIRYGLCVGSSDLVGWTPVTITPDMVGQQVAVFTACEVKTDKGRATNEQTAFIEAVRRAGGIAGVARSEAEAVALLAPAIRG